MRVTRLRLKIMEIGGPQYMIAARAGIPPTTFSSYVVGHTDIPPRHILRLCEVLECNPRDIVGWDDSDQAVAR